MNSFHLYYFRTDRKFENVVLKMRKESGQVGKLRVIRNMVQLSVCQANNFTHEKYRMNQIVLFNIVQAISNDNIIIIFSLFPEKGTTKIVSSYEQIIIIIILLYFNLLF